MLRRVYTVALLIALVVISMGAMAATPQLISYQGRMVDAAGEVAPDGDYALSFAIYDAATDGTLLWNETQPAVTVKDGIFSVMLGSVAPLADSVFGDAGRFLEVMVGQQVLGPRTQFSSVGFAHRISTVDGATGGDLSGGLTITPESLDSAGNAITIVNDNDQPVLSFALDANQLINVSLYDPADSKAGEQNLAAIKALDISVLPDGRGTISFYDPADAIDGANAVASKRIEMGRDGLIMFGDSELDTSLFVALNGDIVGLGQITMGENSSDGVNTAVLGFNNNASGDSSSIGGGSGNLASGTSSTIGGGYANQTSGEGSTVGGGSTNSADQPYATVAGGFQNVADGAYATVPGGDNNLAGADHSYAAGHRAKAEHTGSFVWADHTDEDFVSTADDQFIIRASGGVGIGTNNPTGALEVVGPGGDTAVILPQGAIGSDETADEPGLASNRSNADMILTQGAAQMVDLTTATITTPVDGYIIVRAEANVETTSGTGRNQSVLQIDEAAGGTELSPYFVQVGFGVSSGEALEGNSAHYFPISTERIFIKPAGTYEFRLEARAHPNNTGGAMTTVHRPSITAIFIPTAYGDVVQ